MQSVSRIFRIDVVIDLTITTNGSYRKVAIIEWAITLGSVVNPEGPQHQSMGWKSPRK